MTRSYMKWISLTGIVCVAVFAIVLPSTRAEAGRGLGYTVAGCWYADLYFGDPNDPATTKLPIIATFNSEGTLQWSSTASWGDHPLMPGNKAGAQGVWQRTGLTIEARGIWFDETGGGAGVSIGRVAGEVAFTGPDELAGLVDFDFVACPDGTLGCIDPTQGDFLQMGHGLGPFPILYHRLQ